MSNFNVKEIWAESTKKADNHYKGIGDVEKLARKKSKDILQKIHRNMLQETFSTVILTVVVAVGAYYYNPLVLYGFLIITTITMYITLKEYYKFRRRVKNVAQQNIIVALRDYIQLTGRYLKRLKLLVNYLTPVASFIFVTIIVLADAEGRSTKLILLHFGLTLLIIIPLIIFIIRFANKKYIWWLYGRQHEKLKETLHSLEDHTVVSTDE